MIKLFTGSVEQVFDKARWIWGLPCLEWARKYQKEKRGEEIDDAYIGYNDFTGDVCLVLNEGGFEGLVLARGSRFQRPYIEEDDGVGRIFFYESKLAPRMRELERRRKERGRK